MTALNNNKETSINPMIIMDKAIVLAYQEASFP